MCGAGSEQQGGPGRGRGARAAQCVQAAVVALVACACLEACLAVPTAGVQRDPRHYGRPSSQSQQTTHSGSGTYCGSRLSDALKFMCNGQYNSYFKTKKTPAGDDLAAGGAAKQKRRDDSWIKRETQAQGAQTQARARREAEELWAQIVQEETASQLPFRERLRAAALLDARPAHSRVARGVFDECCTKSCTLDELMSYCEVVD